MTDTVHIVCLDAPSPPDYGGVFDLHYKIPALYRQGKKIILHYFDYRDAGNAEELEPFCEAIYTYKRSSFLRSLSSGLPYIVHSRINMELIKRLNQDKFPVILEGIHCSGIIPFLDKSKKLVLRLHNDEAAYYQHLSHWEQNFLKKQYLQRESRLLENYQKQLPKHLAIAAVSSWDQANFRNTYGFGDVHFIPCFLPWQEVTTKEGHGSFCLYHGNLRVSENIEAVQWLIGKVFRDLQIPLVIAGRGAAALSSPIKKPHISFVDNPGDEQLNELIANAHIHVLPSFNRTGVKIKLLHALFQGRYCLTNKEGVLGSGLPELIPGPDESSWIAAIKGMMNTPFTNEQKKERQLMVSLYNNEANARKLNSLLS